MPHNHRDILVDARSIGVRREQRWIFRYVDFQVRRGETVFVIGANGAGKSTCVKTALGLIRPDEGIVEQTPSLRTGYVPQRLAVTPTLPLTVRRMMTLTGRFASQDVEAALEEVGLHRLGDPPVHTLSGGEFQRLLLAQALIHRPNMLVLDEPDQGVDVTGAAVLYSLVRSLRRELGCGILIISHNIERVMEDADDFVVLVPHEHDNSFGRS